MAREVADYVRIAADAEGESHFEDVRLAGEERPGANATSLVSVSAALGVEDAFFRRVVREASDAEPHNVAVPELIVLLVGEMRVTVSDGESREFGPGSVVLAEDVTGRGHVTRGRGDSPRLTLVARLERPALPFAAPGPPR